jgi:hypothetical protein
MIRSNLLKQKAWQDDEYRGTTAVETKKEIFDTQDGAMGSKLRKMINVSELSLD